MALRITFLPLAPALSQDVYRYLWDGLIQLDGQSPFLTVPSELGLILPTPWFGLIPDAAAATPHAPFAQMVFLALAVAGGTVVQAKLLWIGMDLGVGWMLGRVALFSGRSRRLTQLLYLWSPLLVVEVAWSGHMIPLTLFLLTLVVLLARAPGSSGLAAGLASMVTPISLAAVPPLARRMGRRFFVGCLGGILLAVLPYAWSGRGMLRGALAPVSDTTFLEGPFLLLASALPGDWLPRVAAALAVLAVGVWAAAHRYRPERALLWVLGAAVVLTPALHPCVVLGVLPFAALRVSRPWLAFTGLSFFAYVAVEPGLGGTLVQPVWVHLVVWLPLLGMLAWEGRTAFLERFPPPAPTLP